MTANEAIRNSPTGLARRYDRDCRLWICSSNFGVREVSEPDEPLLFTELTPKEIADHDWEPTPPDHCNHRTLS